MFLSTVKPNLHLNYCSPLYPYSSPSCNTVSLLSFPLSPCFKHGYPSKDTRLNARSNESDLKPQDSSSLHPDSKSKAKKQHQKSKDQKIKDNDSATIFPTTIPKKPRRGRKSEAAAVEDFVRDSLEQTFASIRQQNPDILKDGVNIVKEKIGNEVNSDGSDDDEDDNEEEIKAKKMVVEEDNPDWPLDAEVGWGIRASDYFQKHPIKNVVGEDGTEIDWEGEIEDSWVKEINCLEWETFAFHPSPLIVFVFERYNQ